jgi:hypothetical protein
LRVRAAYWQTAAWASIAMILLPLPLAAAEQADVFSGCWATKAFRSKQNGQVVCFGSSGRVKITTLMGHTKFAKIGRFIHNDRELLIDFPADQAQMTNVAWPAFAESVLCEWQLVDDKSLSVTECFAVNAGKSVGPLDLQKDDKEKPDLEWAKW